eukprot:2695257-Prorocentrum_lima.AAC.1
MFWAKRAAKSPRASVGIQILLSWNNACGVKVARVRAERGGGDAMRSSSSSSGNCYVLVNRASMHQFGC